MEAWLADLKWGEGGLLPTVVQDARTGRVLMLAWADEEAVRRSLRDGRAWFFSRSRQDYWLKGETSGNHLDLMEVRYDCDADTLLYLAHPQGPACHTGAESCFFRTGWARAGAVPSAAAEDDVLAGLYRLVLERKAAPPAGSYVARLLAEGQDRILQKVGEEAVEVVLAGKNDDRARLAEELADLMFHISVLLGERELPWEAVWEVLRQRRR